MSCQVTIDMPRISVAVVQLATSQLLKPQLTKLLARLPKA